MPVRVLAKRDTDAGMTIKYSAIRLARALLFAPIHVEFHPAAPSRRIAGQHS
jgi:hypothetical protein